MQALKFKNFSDEDFVGVWNSVPFTIPAGMEMYFEDYKAQHFAKHLIDRELNRLDIKTNNQVERNKLMSLALPGDEPISPEEVVDKIEKAKRAPRKKKVEKEEEFSDLDE